MYVNCYSNSSRYNNAIPKRIFTMPSNDLNEATDSVDIEGD